MNIFRHLIRRLTPTFRDCGLWIVQSVLVLFLLFSGQSAYAQTVCARVQLEIQQELVLERQAFDARMRITNELADIPLENINVDVKFVDENGSFVEATSDTTNTTAKFFIRLDTMDGVDDVTGNGVIESGTTAEVHWLIIPAPGASGSLAAGTFYGVGATLSYTYGGKSDEIELSPDFITVRALPSLTLDYFVTRDLFADDVFTDSIEPPVPFSLGVRVKNDGTGVAPNLQLDSAQPDIVDNVEGLPIDFRIVGSEVNSQPATASLLADFGDVPGLSTTTARWIMETTLSGQFVEFGARYSHDDALGGELTSLIESVNTHSLLRDVYVDLPGRDGVLDFLALDGDIIRVYESNGLDTTVADQSQLTALSAPQFANGSQFVTLDAPTTAGFLYTTVADPFGGRKEVVRAVRSDGKVLPDENVWFSKTRNGTGWRYWLSLFDTNSTGDYTIVLGDGDQGPLPPALQAIADRTVIETHQVSFIVEASDPNGDPVVLTATALPAGATFQDDGEGVGVFDWTPVVGQAGSYSIAFTASDGVLSTSRTASITVNSKFDTDGDGLPDAWELAHFGTLDRDGTGDYDGDGISDLEEFLAGTDPTLSSGPAQPQLLSPFYGDDVFVAQPTLEVSNSVSDQPTPLLYEFELYADAGLSQLVAAASGVNEGDSQTAWQVPQALQENAVYHWRSRSTDGSLNSPWNDGSFRINLVSEPPTAPLLVSPGNVEVVASVLPTLKVTQSSDPEGGDVRYEFHISNNPDFLSGIVTSGFITSSTPESHWVEWTLSETLSDNTFYYWKVTAIDVSGLSIESDVWTFFVDDGSSEFALPQILYPSEAERVGSSYVDLVVDNSMLPAGGGFQYEFEVDTVASFDSIDKIASGLLPADLATTFFTVTQLEENTRYFWRVKLRNTDIASDWRYSTFRVDLQNEPPSVPTIENPGDGSWSATISPRIAARAVFDPEADIPVYRFEVYADEELTDLIAENVSQENAWSPEGLLQNNTWHYLRVRAEDSLGAASEWSSTSSFYIAEDDVDEAPQLSIVENNQASLDNPHIIVRWNDFDPDSSALVSLFYTSIDGQVGPEPIGTIVDEDPDGISDQLVWDLLTVPAGEYRIHAVIADDSTINTVYADQTIVVNERMPPTMASAAVTPNPVVLTTPVLFSASADDQLTGESIVSEIEWSFDGGPYRVLDADDGLYDSAYESGSTQFIDSDTAGIYNVCFRASDEHGNRSAPLCEELIVQDANTGSVNKSTGDFYSVSGSDVIDPTSEGKASFKVDAKFKNNSFTPTGNFEFDVASSNLQFNSSSIEWLIVDGDSKAALGGFGELSNLQVCQFEVELFDESLLLSDGIGVRIFNCSGNSGAVYSSTPQPLTKGKVNIKP